jgi:DNA-binding PadR family transcriptional regulator
MRDTTEDRWFRGGRELAHLRRALEARGHKGAEAPPERHGRHRGRAPFTGDPEFRGHGYFGFGGPGGPFGRFPFGRGPKARRGDVRAAALVLLAETPANGYQLMQEIESRSGGLWRPSPGSMYPVLQQLEDEGLVRPDGPEGRRVYQLTDAGRTYVTEHADELGTPWATVADSVDGNVADLRGLLRQVVMAAGQVMHAGNDRQVAQAQEVLADSRRRLYRILAEDETADDEPAAPQAER